MATDIESNHEHPEAEAGYGAFTAPGNFPAASQFVDATTGSHLDADLIENYEEAQISIALSLRRLVGIAEDLLDLGESLRGLDGAKRVAAYVEAVKTAFDDLGAPTA
jgi:hypothetical protein